MIFLSKIILYVFAPIYNLTKLPRWIDKMYVKKDTISVIFILKERVLVL